MEQLERTGDAGELGHDVGEVDQHQQGHQQESDAQAEFLADQIGQPFAGHRAHAGAHFLGNDEDYGDREQRP